MNAVEYLKSGRDTYAGRRDAWHMLGNVIGKYATIDEIAPLAGADFEVGKFQLSFAGKKVQGWGTFRIDATIPKGLEDEAIPLKLADGTIKYLTMLAQVGKGYEVIHQTLGFKMIDQLVASIDGSHYETMGVLDWGRVVWGQVNPNLSIRVGDDISDILLTFLTSHDATRSWDIYETAKRQVCRNTVEAGSLARLAATLRVRHTKGAQKRIDSLTTEIGEIKDVAMSMQERLTYLAGRQVQKVNLVSIMDKLFPKTKDDDGVETSSSRRDNILAKILTLYDNNDNNAFLEQRGTAYNLLNAITNYADHQRGNDSMARAKSAVFGSGNTLKNSALDLILAEAEGMPLKPVRGESVAVNWADLGMKVGRN